jgi:hypothetical protein
MRNTWVREICRQDWGGHVRVRVFARKRLKREPTKKEFEDFSEEGRRAHSVSPEEVMAAFAKGEEVSKPNTIQIISWHILRQSFLIRYLAFG